MDRHGEAGGIFGEGLIVEADWRETVLGREFGETGIGAMGWNFARRCSLAWSKLSVERRRETAGIFGVVTMVETD